MAIDIEDIMSKRPHSASKIQEISDSPEEHPEVDNRIVIEVEELDVLIPGVLNFIRDIRSHRNSEDNLDGISSYQTLGKGM